MEVIPNLSMTHLSQERGMEQILILTLPSSPLVLCGCQMHQACFICWFQLQLAPPHIVHYLHHLVTTWGFWVCFQGSSLNCNRPYDQVSCPTVLPHPTVSPLLHQWACFPLSILRRRRGDEWCCIWVQPSCCYPHDFAPGKQACTTDAQLVAFPGSLATTADILTNYTCIFHHW